MERVKIAPRKKKCKGKGASYERKTCQRLSLWVSGMRREDVFWRSAMSGGRATLRSRTNHAAGRKDRIEKFNSPRYLNQKRLLEAHTGDIVATHKDGYPLLEWFVVECKHYRDLELQREFFGNVSEAGGFFTIVLSQAAELGKQPLLIMKQNNQPDLVATTKLGAEILLCGGGMERTIYVPRLGMHVYKLRDMLLLDCAAIYRENIR